MVTPVLCQCVFGLKSVTLDQYWVGILPVLDSGTGTVVLVVLQIADEVCRSKNGQNFDRFATRNTSEATAVYLAQIRKPVSDVKGILGGFSPRFGHFLLALSLYPM